MDYLRITNISCLLSWYMVNLTNNKESLIHVPFPCTTNNSCRCITVHTVQESNFFDSDLFQFFFFEIIIYTHIYTIWKLDDLRHTLMIFVSNSIEWHVHLHKYMVHYFHINDDYAKIQWNAYIFSALIQSNAYLSSVHNAPNTQSFPTQENTFANYFNVPWTLILTHETPGLITNIFSSWRDGFHIAIKLD